jgi:uncharacterized membrane protein
VALFTILLVSVFLAGSAAAQSTLVEIRNNSGEKRKICMYKDADRLAKIPYKCFVLSAKEKVVWNRAGDTLDFKAKVFRPAVVDKLLHYARVPGLTTQMVMGRGSRFAHSSSPVTAGVTKYRLRVCNNKLNQEVFVAVSFETNDHFVTQGWFSVKKGAACKYLDVSDLLNQQVKLEYGFMPRIHYYAETRGAKPLYWSGGANGKALCVSNSKEFNLIHKRSETYNIPCHVNVQRKEYFRLMPSLKSNEVVYRMTF